MKEKILLEIQDITINMEDTIDIEKILKKLRDRLNGEKDGKVST